MRFSAVFHAGILRSYETQWERFSRDKAVMSIPGKDEVDNVKNILEQPLYIILIFLSGFLLANYPAVKLFVVDVYGWISLWIAKRKGEQKRSTAILNTRIRKDLGNTVSYGRIRVERVKSTEDDKPSIDPATFLRSMTLVLRLSESATNMSDNMAKLASEAVVYGYLSDVNRYIDPDLKKAMTNVETELLLGKTKDFCATAAFMEAKVTSDKIAEYEEIIRRLKRDGVYDNLFVPVILGLQNCDHPDDQVVQSEVIAFLEWLNEPKERLETYLSLDHLPMLGFVYLKLATTPLDAHVTRAWQKFDDGCEAVVLYGRATTRGEMKIVSRRLLPSFPVVQKFLGHRWHLNKNEQPPDADADLSPTVGVIHCRKDAKKKLRKHMP